MTNLKRRVISGIGANVFGQGINIGIQLLSLPVFLHYWSMSQYGEWLMLSAIPAFFSLADVGMVNVAKNKMTMLTAKGEGTQSNIVFQSSLLLTTIILISVGSISALLISMIDSQILSSDDRKLALILLIVVALGNIFSGLFDAIFRASGHYALGIYLLNFARIAEWLGSIIGLITIGTFVATAFGYFVGRMIASIALLLYCQNRFRGFSWGYQHAKLGELKSMAIPALSFMSFPAGNAISIQGMTLLVGSMFGPAFVALFNIYRTISRVVVQLTGTLSHSLSPEFSRLYGVMQLAELRRLYGVSMLVSFFIILISSAFLQILFPWILEIWTNGKVDYEWGVASLFVLYTFFASLWHIPRILVLSTNRHGLLSVANLITSITGVTVAWLSTGILGVYSAITMLTVQELLMLMISGYEAKIISKEK